MKCKTCFVSILVLCGLHLILAFPLLAGDYYVSDISLTPGAEETQLNVAWHADVGVEGDVCEVKIAKKGFFLFPSIYSRFNGATGYAGVDEDGIDTYYCEVIVSGLEPSTDYVYRLGDGNGNWSDIYEFTSRDPNEFGFIFLADAQIGASGPRDLSRSRDIKPYIAEYQTRLTFPQLSDDDIETIADAYIDDALDDIAGTYPTLDLDALEDAIDDLYSAFKGEYTSEGPYTDLEELTALDPTLADEILALIADRLAEQMTAAYDDTQGWSETVGIMREQFPESAFIMSLGDQVEENDREYEYTGLFAPMELTSLPLAPTIGSHDRAVNFDYHFNLPNESADYGVNTAGGDYYFTYGNALFMVLNIDTTRQEYPKGPPPGPPPGGGGPPPPPGWSSPDADNDGVDDDDDLCPDTPEGTAVDDDGCPLPPDGDYDGDGVLNADDQCNNTPAGYEVNGYGCPYDDVDSDGIPDDIDRCNNTYDDMTVDEDGCADCGYIETDDELIAMIEDLENSCETDPDTGIEICEDELADFKASLAEHRTFMEEAMAANPDVKWKIVAWHYSCYSAAMHSTDDELEALRLLFTPVLDELGIDVVLMGHDHAYTRTHQMLGNEPQNDQIISDAGQIVNPTGTLYLTASSSSGSKYYDLNCNIGDDTSSSASYYDYAAAWYDQSRTFTYMTLKDDSLELSTYTYDLGDTIGTYETILIDDYSILIDPDYDDSPDDVVVEPQANTGNGDGNDLCFITAAAYGISGGVVWGMVFAGLICIVAPGALSFVFRRR